MQPQEPNVQNQPGLNQSVQNTQPVVQSTPQPQPMQPAYFTPAPQENSGKKWLLVVLVIVALLIAAAASFFVFGRSDNDDKSSSSKNSGSSGSASTDFDNEYKLHATRLVAAVNIYIANNNGKVPALADMESVVSSGIDGEFADPNTNNPYEIVSTSPDAGEMQYKSGATCSSDNEISAGSKRQFAVRVLLGSGDFHCASS